MNREFLANLKVGEQSLPKEIIDAILDENSRDISAAKTDAVKPYSDYEDIKGKLATAQTTIQQLKGQQSDQLVDGKTAQQWKEAHDQAVADHQKEMDGIKFQHVLDGAIVAAKGKNAKAITALLDVDTLRGSEDQQKAIDAALETLKKENGYLFETEKNPPPYAGGTGAQVRTPASPATLADALRERYDK